MSDGTLPTAIKPAVSATWQWLSSGRNATLIHGVTIWAWHAPVLFDAAVTGVLAAMILILIVEALVHWYAILSHRKESVLHESPYIATRWAADYSGAAHGDD